MKRILTLLVFVFLVVFSGCEDIQDPSMSEGGVKIASPLEQVDAIKVSLPKLKKTLNSLKSLTSEPQSQGASASTRASSNGNINNVKEYILALEERIEALEAYVYDNQPNNWTETTYATIEMYEETIGVLAYIQCEIEALKETLETTKEEILEDVATNINDCFDSMKLWVNEQLTGYYDIAATDAMLAKLQESLTAEDESVRKDVEALRKDLAEQMDDMRNGYKSAIKSAIEENNGILDAKLKKVISELNARVDDVIEDMDERMKDIEDRLGKLEGTVEALINRIQSIAYIPIFDDEKARVNFPNTDTSEGRLTLDFKISPKNAVEDLVKAARTAGVVTVQALYTGTAKFVDLPLVECSADGTEGVFTVTVECDSLNMDFYNGDLNARAIMYISDGNNDKNSEYIPLIPNLIYVPNNQIWYSVMGKTPVEIEIVNGPKIVSNSYDLAKGCYVVTFDQSITTIPYSYFAGKQELKTVSLPNSIKRIENSAFEGCTNLSQIALGNSVTSIGTKAFKDCALTYVELPKILNTIGADAFDYTEIQSFNGGSTENDGLTLILNNKIKAVAFGGIKDGKYAMPAGVISVDADVFKNCTKISEVNIDNIQAWFNIDFVNQYSNPLHNGAVLKLDNEEVTDVTFPEIMTVVKPYTFYGCNSLRSVTLHSKVAAVSESAFSNCSNLSVLSLQAMAAPSFGDNVFEGCDKLKIYIPNNEEAIKSYISCNWYNLYQHLIVWNVGVFPKNHCIEYTTSDNKPVVIQADNLHSNTYENGKGVITFTVPCTSFRGFASGNERILTCTLPESVEVIGNSSFEGCSNMLSFVIPDAVTAIKASAFKGCRSLTDITIPQNVSEIGASAFEGCSSLSDFVLPSKVTTIGSKLFAGCVKLNNVLIHKGITSIGERAFAGCTGLTSLEFESTTPPVIHTTSFDECHNLKITIPTDETSLRSYLAGSWSDAILQKIPYILDPANLPSGYWIEYTTNDNQPVQFKDSNIFHSYYLNDRGVALSRNKITSFGGFATGAERILTCTLPESVEVIGNSSFEGCSNMLSFVIPDAVTAIKASAFKGCRSLTDITIPQNVSEIGASAFEGCSSLSDFVLPSKVTTIGSKLFAGCVKLNNVLIHKGITSIGERAFAGCTGLTSLEFESTTPPVIHTTSFDECHNLKITIPTDETSLRSYLAGSWSDAILQKIPYILDPANLPSGYWIEYTTNDNQPVQFKDSNIFHSYYLNDRGVALSRNKITSFDGFTTGAERILTCTLPESVTIISNSAFKGCSAMTTYEIDSNIKEIQESAFNGCTNLTKVIFHSSTPPIVDANAFETTLMCIDIPESAEMQYIQCDWSIRYKRLIQFKEYPESHLIRYKTLNAQAVTVNESLDAQLLKNTYDGGEGILILDRPVVSIPENAFNSSTYLSEITFPSILENIGSKAFYSCRALKTLVLPDNLIEIGDNAFYGATNLETVTLGSAIKKIGNAAFYSCENLTSINLPDGILEIGMSALSWCENLNSIHIYEMV